MVLHYLVPEDDGLKGQGGLLSPEEIIQRLKQEFNYVVIDKKRGNEHIRERLQYLQNLRAKGKNPFGIPFDNEISRLESVQDKTLHITFFDDDPPRESYLSTYLIPGDSRIMFSYCTPSHSDEAEPLLERCADVLKCDIEEGG